MKNLDKVTLVIIDTFSYGRALHSLKKSLSQITPAKTLFFTDIEMDCGESIEVVKIDRIKSKDEYSQFVLKQLWKYIDTDFILLTQWDSWVLNSNEFDERLYMYDYAGALWPEQDGLKNGNGGFSWRSKRLLDCIGEDDFVNANGPEDVTICRVFRGYLEQKYALFWAPDDICESFSFELQCPVKETFGFHSWFHKTFQKTAIIKRQAALGDVVQVEPVLYYFYKNGYRVVLDTLPQFQNLFIQHYFKVHTLGELDPRLLETAKRYDLDFSYESNPAQLHLKTYFAFCEVPESEMILRNPILNLNIPREKGTKLFKKYCVLHLATRAQKSRDIQGNINWEWIVSYLNTQGYTVIQIGGSPQEDVKGAIQMMTPGEPFLMWVIREADLFIGIDSGPSNIAVGFNVPLVVFSGSVDMRYIHADLSNICIIDRGEVCETPKCWHRAIGCEGMECVVEKESPPCVQFDHDMVMDKISKFIKKINNDKN